jgi:hypothetical protein
MYRLDLSSVRGWAGSGVGDYRPTTFDTTCPHCQTRANFTVADPLGDPNRGTTSATATCARCRKNVFIWTIGDRQELYMRPAPITRQPVRGADLMSEPAQRAYNSALNVFNVGEWDATAVQTGITLEGIVHQLLPDDLYDPKEPLAKQLEKLAQQKSEDLAKPLITLSHTLREGRNIGAHFDMTRQTNQDMANAMLDLLDYLIEYTYTLPQRIQEANARIRDLGEEEEESES